MNGWVWRGCCYFADEVFPHGFCRKCWIAYGMPKAVDMSQYPEAQEMIDNG